MDKVNLNKIRMGQLLRTASVAMIATTLGIATPLSALKAQAIDEIIVTAQKRAQSLQDVGIAISAFDEQDVKDLGLGDIEQLAAAVPNLQSLDDAAGLTSFRIRGIGLNEFQASFDSPVGVHLDEVFMSKPILISMGFFDVERIEVLKGPQGTVFGRNTSGGAVNYYSNRPTDEFEGGVTVGYGRFERAELEGYISGPISENLNARLAVQAIDQKSGRYDNLLTGGKIGAYEQQRVRGQLEWSNEETTVLMSAHYGSMEGDLTPYDNLYQTTPGGVPDVTIKPKNPISRNVFNQDHWPTTDSEAFGATLRIEHGLGELGTLVSLTGYEEFERDNREDSDNTPTVTLNVDWYSDIEQFTQELRLSGERGDWNYLIGAYYDNNELDTVELLDSAEVLGVLAGTEHTVDAESYALFTSHEYTVNDRLSLTLGARYTEEENEIIGDTFTAAPTATRIGKASRIPLDEQSDTPGLSIAGGVNTSRTDQDFNFKLGANVRPADDILVFASYSTGFRSGGYDLAFASASLETFDPEEVKSWEVGLKSSFADRSIIFNASLFNTIIENYQGNVNLATELTPRRRNIGELETKGVEAELKWSPTEEFLLNLSAGYTDAEISEVATDASGAPFAVDGISLQGNKPVNTPEWSYGAIAVYTVPIGAETELQALANYSWVDERYLEIQNSPAHKVSSYNTLDASVSVGAQDGNWRVSVWGKNITDEEYLRYINDIPAFGIFLTINAAPATYGVSLNYKF